jgi:hypothetical protein
VAKDMKMDFSIFTLYMAVAVLVYVLFCWLLSQPELTAGLFDETTPSWKRPVFAGLIGFFWLPMLVLTIGVRIIYRYSQRE